MADIGSKSTWLVSANREVEEKWLDVQIQEKISRRNNAKQRIDDLMKGVIIGLQADIIMLDKEISNLKRKKDALKTKVYNNENAVDV